MASSTIGRDMAGPSLPEKVDLPHHVDRNTLSDRAKRSLAWKSSQIAKFPVPVRRPVRRAQYWSRDATHPLSTLPPGEDPFVNKQAADPRHSATSGEVESEAPTGSEGLEIIKNVPNSQMPSTKPTQTQIEHAATLKAQEAENIQRLEQHVSLAILIFSLVPLLHSTFMVTFDSPGTVLRTVRQRRTERTESSRGHRQAIR